MIPALTNSVKNFVSSLVPQAGQPISARTHAAAVAGLALMTYYNPVEALGIAATYVVGTFIWNSTAQNEAAVPVQAPVIHARHAEQLIDADEIPQHVLDASFATALHEEEVRRFVGEEKKEPAAARHGPLFEDVDDDILMDGSKVEPQFQVKIGNEIFDIRNVVKMMLSKHQIQHPTIRTPLFDVDLLKICIGLGISVADFKRIWTENEGQIREMNTEIQHENDFSTRAQVQRAMQDNPQQDEGVLFAEIGRDVAEEGDQRLNKFAEEQRTLSLLNLLQHQNPELVGHFDQLFISQFAE